MNYSEINFILNPYEEYVCDILSNELAEIGFDSFVTHENGITAYIAEKDFDEKNLNQLLKSFLFDNKIQYEIGTVPQKNWNEEWEKNYFKPIVIGDECVIHSSFHTDVPKARYNIVIDPKMSFGTGHHETTSLMIEEILKMDLQNKKVLDMGCGTSVLAILAAVRGANNITAIDIDEWCTENSHENISLNKVTGINVMQGGAELLKGMNFDIIIANINRNILLADIDKYAACLSQSGELYMSGFYVKDIPVIEKEANNNGLYQEYYKEKNNWAVMKTIKKQKN